MMYFLLLLYTPNFRLEKEGILLFHQWVISKKIQQHQTTGRRQPKASYKSR